MSTRIPFDRYRVTLRLRKPAHFHFLHNGVLQGLVRRALGSHELPPGLLFHASENGRTRFDARDAYAFALTFAGETRGAAASLLSRLDALGAAPPSPGPLPVLGGNFEVEEVRPLLPVDLERQIDAARAAADLTLRFLSPLRLERPPERKARGAGYVNRDCFPPDHFLRRLWQRLFLVEHGRYPVQSDRAAMPPLDGTIENDPSSLLWIDLPIPGSPGQHQDRKGLTLGGVLGAVALRSVPEPWIDALVSGQYLHAGEKTAFGLGRYVLEETGAIWDEALRPSRSLLALAAEPRRLHAALDHLLRHSEAAGVDGVAPAELALRAEEAVPAIAQRLSDGTWEPSDLLGFLGRKDDGGVRPLAIPTVADRIAQRAVCDVLGPSIDTLLEDCSYAYRKGFSRAGAARAIERAWNDGFRWVLDADISSFFDLVSWPLLFAKLRALFAVDPAVPLIERWMVAPVVFEGRRIERRCGLPQGSPLAPLLANLFLDEFDEEILGLDYRLVRYADDFVVLCREPEAARAAREAVVRALGRLRLELNEEKTGIRSLDAGLTYLGYLFCRSTVMESGAPAAGADHEPGQPPQISPSSWLAQVPLEKIRPVARRKEAQPRQAEAVPLARDTAPDIDVAPLYVVQPGTRLWLQEGRIVLQRADEAEVTLPLRRVSHVVCFTGTHPTVPLLLALSQQGKPVFFCGHDGALDAAFHPWDPDWPLWSSQLAAAADAGRVVRFVRAVVSAKLHNAAAVVARQGLDERGGAAHAIRELERQCENKSEVDSLRGLEGRGAVLFFEAFRSAVPAEWGFRTRERHPPPDPVNAMLSFAYTMLHNHAATAIVAAGLNPRIGMFHQGRGTWAALASDLSEELRFLAESFVLAMVRRREIMPADFVRAGDPPGMLLRYEARREFIARFEERLLTSFTPPGEEKATTYLEFIAGQARRLRDFVTGRGEYVPLRIHS